MADLKHIAKEKALGSDGSPGYSWLCPRWGLVTEGSCLQRCYSQEPPTRAAWLLLLKALCEPLPSGAGWDPVTHSYRINPAK